MENEEDREKDKRTNISLTGKDHLIYTHMDRVESYQ